MEDLYNTNDNNINNNIGNGEQPIRSGYGADANNNVNQGVNPSYNSQPYVSQAQNYGSQNYGSQNYNSQPYTSSPSFERSQVNSEVIYGTNKKNEKKSMPAGLKILIGAITGLAFGACAGLAFYAVTQVSGTKTAITAEATVDSSQIDKLEQKISELESQMKYNSSTGTAVTTESSTGTVTTSVTTDVTEVVEKVMPSMVSVTNLYEEQYSFWGRTYTQESEASGSGIIIGENDKEYIIVTNHHVIENAVQLTIQFVDDTQAPASIKGSDESVDIAVIAVSKSNVSEDTQKSIRVATLGDSDALKIGEPAIAIGNALGYGQSVTTGVISAINRDINMENSSDSLIQTNAAINPGNSGGALLNIRGEVIGISSSKIGGNMIEGMCYAIPISQVKDIIEELSTREVKEAVTDDQRGYLGIQGATVDETTAATYSIPQGVFVTKVYERSAAGAAGIIKGDVITKVDGQSITTLEELQSLLSFFKGGDQVEVILYRAGTDGYEEMTYTVTLSTKDSFEE